MDIGKGHRKSLQVGIPLPVVDKCRNMFIASICINGNLNTMKFGLKVNIATGKSLLRRALRLSHLLSKYKGKFADVIGSSFKELKKKYNNQSIRKIHLQTILVKKTIINKIK
eukprot:360766_1